MTSCLPEFLPLRTNRSAAFYSPLKDGMEARVSGLTSYAALIAAALATSNAPSTSGPPPSGRVSEYRFEGGITASRPSDRRIYILLGGDFLDPLTSDDPRSMIYKWLKRHPNAIVTPISRIFSTNIQTHEPIEVVYVWVEDGGDSLNVDLIRTGSFEGRTMHDMVENAQGFEQQVESHSQLADTRAATEKKDATPPDRIERLIADEAYESRIARINEAERVARSKKLGIWSDAMKKQRETHGTR